MNPVRLTDIFAAANVRYAARTGHCASKHPLAVLFDMDGILYDSMPGHCKAWKQMCDENGLQAEADEFLAYEGCTGASTINILMQRQYGREAAEEEVRRLYGRKSELFKAMGPAPLMPGAREAVGTVLSSGSTPVLVTGSGQASILEKLDHDYPGAFPASRRVTALDVRHGKPDPEPFLMGLAKVGLTEPFCAVGVDNAPLGVQSASAAGLFTIGVRTGALPQGSLLAAGADMELSSMVECGEMLQFMFGL